MVAKFVGLTTARLFANLSGELIEHLRTDLVRAENIDDFAETTGLLQEVIKVLKLREDIQDSTCSDPLLLRGVGDIDRVAKEGLERMKTLLSASESI